VKRLRWVLCLVGLSCAIHSKMSLAQTAEPVCTVRLYDRPNYKGQISVRWSSDASTTFELKGSDRWLTSPPIKLPATANEVQIEGSLAGKSFEGINQKAKSSSKLRLVDFTSAIAPLRVEESWGKRMSKFVQELRKIENKHEDRAESPSEWIESNGPVAQSKLQLAEQRLKFALPIEHAQMLQDYGAWSRDDSYCVSADELDRADKQMRTIWGSPASEFASLSDKNKAIYRASTMLFVEPGDGYGALIYHPLSSGGEYYWIHQENLDEPVQLVDSQGKLRDYSGAMRWVIANQILVLYEDALSDHVFTDRSSHAALPYDLSIEFINAHKMEAQLDVDWAKFE
jgi:hypothetical protein